MELELNMLAVMQYDFEFEFPFSYVRQYFNILKQEASVAKEAANQPFLA